MTQNNLCVISAACCSFNAITEIEIGMCCPFSLLIAPEQEVSFGFIEDRLMEFYKNLFSDLQIVPAFEKALSDKMRIFHSERMLVIVLTRYIKNHCIGKAAGVRQEDLLTQSLSLGAQNDRYSRKRIRRAAKDMIKPTQSLVDRYTEIFLLGKKAELKIADLVKLAKNARAEDQREELRRRRSTGSARKQIGRAKV